MTDRMARAFWVARPGEGRIEAEPLVPAAAGEVLVRTLFSGISRGTEALVFTGRVPPSLRSEMRCPFQAGDFPAPVKYGYAAVGHVEAGPAALLGRSVFCLHPHQDAFVVPADRVVPLPDGLPPGRAVLAANMETALNAVWDAGIGPADRVAVVGAGVVGLLVTALAAAIPGVRPLVVEPDAGRRRLAEALGAGAVAADATGLADDHDVVVHASGRPAGLAAALALAGFEALVLELSWYGDGPVPAPLGAAFHARRLTLRSSQVGAVSPGRRPRWPHARRLAAALALLADARLDALISGESRFEALPAVMPGLADGTHPALCHRIRY
jgi:2-desacetyl-2-hydroxyethyl bacteriochlorophyllide A dehydrogenase